MDVSIFIVLEFIYGLLRNPINPPAPVNRVSKPIWLDLKMPRFPVPQEKVKKKTKILNN